MAAPDKKYLVALDFDHSVIDANSDIYIQKLSPGGKIPPAIEKLYQKDGWTDYMAAIFQHLHQSGVTAGDIEQCMNEIQLVEGMQDLFTFFTENNFDVIIISDANTLFIETILKNHSLDRKVNEVYSNPAEYDSKGCLTIKFYHTQDWCQLSSKNLCKGHILDKFIEHKANKGVLYEKIAFVGDGSNDLCPSLRLRSQDLVFARKGYRLEKCIVKRPEDMKANVVIWNDGHNILEVLKEQCVPKSTS